MKLMCLFCIFILAIGLTAAAKVPNTNAPNSLIQKQINNSNIKALAKIKDVHITIKDTNHALFYELKVDFKKTKGLEGESPRKFIGKAFYKKVKGKQTPLMGTISITLNTDNISDNALVFINDDLEKGHMMFCHILSKKLYKEIKKNGLTNIEFDEHSIKIKE